MSKKYELIMEDNIDIGNDILYRIKALKDFDDVKAGDLGGYIQGEHNLSHDGNCWVYDNARVYGNAYVFDNAKVYDEAKVYGLAMIFDDARISGYARIYGKAYVFRNAKVYGTTIIYENTHIRGNAHIYGNAKLFGNVNVSDDARVYGNTILFDTIRILDNADISSDDDRLYISGLGSENRSTTAFKTSNNDIFIKCGCFEGTLDEFESRVKETHGDNKYGKEYKMLIDMCKLHFNLV